MAASSSGFSLDSLDTVSTGYGSDLVDRGSSTIRGIPNLLSRFDQFEAV